LSSSYHRLLLVGNPAEEHVGAHFLAAAGTLGLEATLVDAREAHSGNIWINRLFHRLMNRRPAHLNRFSQKLVARCREWKPDSLLVTGISAPHAAALQEIGALGIRRANFLTDDPWNPSNGSGFFWAAMKEYGTVFSPRRANLEDLRQWGCQQLEFLPFGYNPALHFPEPPQTDAERARFGCDVVFVGGADADRLPVARALVRAGLNLHLYGGYWERDVELRPHWRGFVHGRELRLAVGGAKVNICLGRKANRDGHAMRSLELPAMGACLVVEDTPEHRDFFGDEGVCVVYYTDLETMVKKIQALVADPRQRERLQASVQRRLAAGRHTYADRLTAILA